MRRNGKAKGVCVELEVMLDLPSQLADGSQPAATPPPQRERIPRVTRLMALAVNTRRWWTAAISETMPISPAWAT